MMQSIYISGPLTTSGDRFANRVAAEEARAAAGAAAAWEAREEQLKMLTLVMGNLLCRSSNSKSRREG